MGTFEVLLTCFYYILYLYIGAIYLKILFSNRHTCLLMDICQIGFRFGQKGLKPDQTELPQHYCGIILRLTHPLIPNMKAKVEAHRQEKSL